MTIISCYPLRGDDISIVCASLIRSIKLLISCLPFSPLSRQDLVSWKMALDKRQLPEVDRNVRNRKYFFSSKIL
jgi:hypothetical protein